MLIANAVASRLALNAPVTRPSTPSPTSSAFERNTSRPADAPTLVWTSVDNAAPPASATLHEPDKTDEDLHQHFQRGLGAYPLRNRAPVALLKVQNTRSPIHAAHGTNSALLASTISADPKNRKQALRDNRAGWTATERAEIANHASNGSWELIDSSSVPTGRSLVRRIYVSKRKRSRSLKVRLCVQGCAQVLSVDFEQTFCATMRATSLLTLAALAVKRGMSMRRWDSGRLPTGRAGRRRGRVLPPTTGKQNDRI
eukprot:15632-Pleurochrysis_carterae.AAC.7